MHNQIQLLLSRRLVFVVVLCCCTSVYAQPSGGRWTTASKLPGLSETGHLLFVDSLLGYYIGHDSGYVTKDGALTWTQITFPPDVIPAPTYLFAPSHNTIIAFQGRRSDGVIVPSIIKSVDMGSTWSVVSTDPLPTIKTLSMWTDNDGFRIWLDDNYNDYCGVTHDGGKTFTDIRGDTTLEKYISKLKPPSPLSIQSAWSDDMHGVLSVYSTSGTKKPYPVLTTSDGGKNWTEHYLKFKGDSSIQHSFVYLYPGSSSIWALPSPDLQVQYFYYSSDFGATWVATDTLLRNGLGGASIEQLAPVSASASWVVMVGNYRNPAGTQNVISYKEIGGKWIGVDTLRKGNFPNPQPTITNMQFVDATHGWVMTKMSALDSVFIYRYATTVPSGVEQLIAYTDLRCVPNPASSKLGIMGFGVNEQVGEIKLIGTLGGVYSLQSIRSDQGIDLDIHQIPNGWYILSVSTSTRRFDTPVLILH
ncbi:MAG: hypothetical protein Q8916_10395 [Bacteroidota bacterium]|nr:hypothetical protein [Bacteroidota bacterium]MDP4230798.1 hypothetical protein [Bacteroidota bacterium]MDP4237801.1 hypothetical protein [Bacteroidota bacterium]